MLILRDLFLGRRRFDEFQASLGVATNVLSSRLATLTEEGIVERRRYSEHPERFDLLIESLQQWWRGFGMQHLAGMRLESNYGRHGADGAGALDHRLHDQLMAKMQTIEHAQRQNRRARDVSVIGAVK